jgi:hypothetical protein
VPGGCGFACVSVTSHVRPGCLAGGRRRGNAQLVISERGKHPDISETAFRGHLKEVLFKDTEWRRIRDHIRGLGAYIDGAEVDRKLTERDIEIGCARMIELGGYLNYLAAAKNASIANKTSEANNTSEAEKA